MPRRWRASPAIAFEGIETGDHRMFETGAIFWRDLPRDFGVVFEDGFMGHEGAVTVGTVDLIERRDGGAIYAEGNLFDNDENADRYANMLGQQGLRNVSVDVCGGRARYEVVDGEGNVLPEGDIEDVLFDPEFDGYVREVWEEAELCSLVAARTCAFADALIELVGEGAPTEEEVAAGLRVRVGVAMATIPGAFTTLADLPVGDEVRWMPDDGDEATATVTAVDEEAGTCTLEINGEPMEAMMEDDDGEEEAATTQAASQAARRVSLAAALARLNGRRVVTASSGRRGPGAVLRASVDWNEGAGPPRSFYEPLQLPGPTPFTITDEGEVFGHIATWDQCHAGFLGGAFRECVRPPRSPSGYRTFYANRSERFSDGSRLPVGVLTMDTRHAPGDVDRRTGLATPDLRTVLRHYEDTGLIAATLRVYDDDFGPYVHGAVCAGLSVDDVRRAMRSAPSGDWRDYGEGLDLAGILMVNQPGYPQVVREEGRTVALVASLSPRRAEVVSPALAHSDCGCGCNGAGDCHSEATATSTKHATREPKRLVTSPYQRLAERRELARMDARVLSRR